MNPTLAYLLVIGSALVLANLPFVSQRCFGIVSISHKSGFIRIAELIVGYFIAGGLGFFLESSLGTVQTQRWEFYALTACLFLVFGFPGFVYRFLWRKR